MRKKIAQKNILLKKHLASILPQMVEQHQKHLVRSTNDRLVTLFWLTGKSINEHFFQNKNSNGKKMIHAAAKKLAPQFGPYFTAENLQMMSLFAEQFPGRSALAQLAPFISWEHLRLLLPLKDTDALLFYTRLTLQQGLRVNDLRKKISANLYVPPKMRKTNKSSAEARTPESAITGRPERKYTDIVALGIANKQVIKNIFKNPVKAFLRPLIIPSKQHTGIVVDATKASKADKDLSTLLSTEIEQFRQTQGWFLNADLNGLFWQIGKRLIDDILLQIDKINDRKSIIVKASRQLKKYGKNFNAQQLTGMILFAEQFSDSSMAHIIGGLLSWEQLLVILPIKDLEERLFYVRLAAGHGLSANVLQKKMAKKVYKKAEKPLPFPGFKMTSVEHTTGNGKPKHTSFSVDLYRNNYGPVPANIFRNNYFVDFISAF